ncbi:DUF4251 domain-containing protein [Mucilaginibacter sp. dw_454]|uniref:DUF4251 domain-containing protein n=1 Tax=Mucilaginibacter sp. dw_454 TaxID=2720079 RepID=UPI001BD49BCA|nr:DUF4251 domain-containing protein [Mucilaginibacter sp. dw_454]
MKRLRLLLLLLVVTGINIAQAQQQPFSAADIKKMADDKKFRFKATTAELSAEENRSGGLMSSAPTKANRMTLSAVYSALLTPDSVVSYLPYFGKSSSEGVETNNIVNSTEENPTKFSATAYTYEAKEKKKGNAVITIKPQDSSKIEKYVYYLELDGSARLELTIAHYKTITYIGYFTVL